MVMVMVMGMGMITATGITTTRPPISAAPS
jgi:hypothetical protein